jgi:hypothetical protein
MTLNEMVNNFIANINEEYIAEENEAFEVDFNEYEILYAVENEADDFFANFVERFPLVANLNPFVASLLHEVGHLETEDEIIDDTEERANITNTAEYFALWNETIATDWAGFFIEDNFEMVAEFNEAIAEYL